MKVQVVYRNYIPLNSPYSSFWNHPPEGVEFLIPAPKPYLKKLFPLYRAFGRLPGVRWAVKQATQLVFSQSRNAPDCDLLFYVGICPEKAPDLPFVVDIEHANALVDFLGPDAFEKARPRLMEVLTHPLCRGIVPISQAAARSLEIALGPSDWQRVKDRVRVIYPSLPIYCQDPGFRASHQMIPARSGLRARGEVNFLFVGKESLRKGLPQVLEAFEKVHRAFPAARLYVVSDTPAELQEKYKGHPAIRFEWTRFTAQEVMTQFFLPADVFVMPTLEDSFGMVFMEALSCGKPVILTRQFATPEIVRDGINGLFLDLPPLQLDRQALAPPRRSAEYQVEESLHRAMVAELEKKMSRFCEDPALVERMSAQATVDYENEGKFSNAYRNRELRALFGIKS